MWTKIMYYIATTAALPLLKIDAFTTFRIYLSNT